MFWWGFLAGIMTPVVISVLFILVIYLNEKRKRSLHKGDRNE